MFWLGGGWEDKASKESEQQNNVVYVAIVERYRDMVDTATTTQQGLSIISPRNLGNRAPHTSVGTPTIRTATYLDAFSNHISVNDTTNCWTRHGVHGTWVGMNHTLFAIYTYIFSETRRVGPSRGLPFSRGKHIIYYIACFIESCFYSKFQIL